MGLIVDPKIEAMVRPEFEDGFEDRSCNTNLQLHMHKWLLTHFDDDPKFSLSSDKIH